MALIRQKKYFLRPSISVVIPCSDDLERLELCLTALRHQSDQADEILCSDNASSDKRAKEISSLASSFGARFIPVTSKHRDPGNRSQARNLGSRFVRSDVILYLDADMLLSIDYIKKIRNIHARDPWALVKGERFSFPQQLWTESDLLVKQPRFVTQVIRDQYRANQGTPRMEKGVLGLFLSGSLMAGESISRRQFLMYGAVVSMLGSLSGKVILHNPLWLYSDRWDYCASNNLSVRKKHVIRIGGWDEKFWGWGEEDMDFSYRLSTYGCCPCFPGLPDIWALHLDHPIDEASSRISMERNARYFVRKNPKMLELRADVYKRFDLNLDWE